MITKATVDILKAAWSQGVQEILSRELEITKNALVDAEDDKISWTLRGKAKAFRAMLKFPEYVANFVEDPSNGQANSQSSQSNPNQ